MQEDIWLQFEQLCGKMDQDKSQTRFQHRPNFSESGPKRPNKPKLTQRVQH